ncbi:MAG: LysR family transcriptional regulator, partial [Rhodospirillaceae bacterium]|nr:LysR family transcriptional regulator [Rhodospirillaceae bacterium]
MEMHQIRYFLAVCETLNFTRAAAQNNVSQPALTKAIKKLEDELGSPLFFREGKRVLVSEFGQLMRPNMAAIYGQTESVRNLAEDYSLKNKTPLNIGVMLTIGPLGLARFLARFQQDHPGVEIEIHEGSLSELTRRLEAGELEIALLSAPMGLDDSFRAEALYDERYVVVFPPNHRLKDMAAIRLKDLSGEAYVDRLSCEMREMVMAVCQENDVELYASYRSEREDWIQGMVLAEMGFAFMPEYSVTASGMLSRPLIEPEVSRTVKLAWMPGRAHTP